MNPVQLVNPQEVRTAFENRSNLDTELTGLYDKADEEKRELTAEEKQTEERLSTEIDQLGESITEGLSGLERTLTRSDQAERLARAEAAAAKGVGPGSRQTNEDHEAIMRMVRGESTAEEFRAPAGFKGLRSLQETRDLSVFDPAGVATPAAGGDLVPTTLFTELYRFLEEDVSIMRALGAPLITTSGEEIQLPKVSSYSTATWIGEGAAIPESDPAFEKVSINAYKLGKLTQITHELETDEVVGVVSFVAEDGARALGRALGTSLISGDNTQKPNGALNTTNSVAAAANTEVTFDDMVDLEEVLVTGYLPGSAWVMNKSTKAVLRKVKDLDGQYIWQRSVQVGEPDTVFGYPVFLDDTMPAIAASADVILFGNFARGYVVRTVGSIRVENSSHFAFANDMMTWRFLGRFDGEIRDENAFAKLTLPA